MANWQLVKFGRFLQSSPGTTFIFGSAFDNGLAARKALLKRLNGNNLATSCTNLVYLRPLISEFTLLKRADHRQIAAELRQKLRVLTA